MFQKRITIMCSIPQQTKQEPLLDNSSNRLTIFPIEYPDIWKKYKKHVQSFWIVEEIDLSKDVFDWRNRLSDEERYFIKHIIAFFASSDCIVVENLMERFIKEVQIPEAKCFYGVQIFMENIHSEMYSLLIDTYIESEQEKKSLFNAIHEFPHIRKKAKWAMNWIESSESFGQRLLAFVIVEGLFFCGSFCAIFWLKQRNILPGLCHSNEFISRDESLHCEFAILLFKKYVINKPEQKLVHKIFDEAVNIESEFVSSAIPVALIGMNANLMNMYICYVADYLLDALGFEKLYNVSNPFSFMEMISLPDKCNFFEKRVSSYRKGKATNDPIENQFSLNDLC